MIVQTLLLLSCSVASSLAKSCYPNCAKIETIYGPPDASQYQSWLATWTNFRQQTLKKVKYSPKIYDTKLLWTQTTFMQPQMMAHDRYFYNGSAYTVAAYVADVTQRYGGIDSVLIWPTYPNIGVDDRNQYDMIRDMPAGFADAIAELNDVYNISVLLPYNPWDVGTRDVGMSDADAVASLLVDTGARGFNGDTLQVVPYDFWNASLRNPLGPAAIEPEEGGDEYSLFYTKLGWGYWTPYPLVPSVDRWKWLEHRHLTHVCERWATDRHDGLQAAFFNGCGYETWENVWGIWNSISERDSAAIMRIGHLFRFVGGIIGGGFAMDSVDFVPYDPVVDSSYTATVFATRFQTNYTPVWGQLGMAGRLTKTASTAPYAFWTVVNRASYAQQVTLNLSTTPNQDCFDLYRGVPFTGSVDLDGYGYGAVLCLPSSRAQSDAKFSAFLVKMAQLTSTPLSQMSTATPVLSQTMIQYSRANSGASTSGMQLIPAGVYNFYVTGQEIEGQSRPGVDFQYPWESQPQLTHSNTFQMAAFYIDTFPITNSQWKAFVQSSGYVPSDDANYLRDWKGGTYPPGWSKKPVTWVSIDDAAAYCEWRGGRLPNEWEWQYAAQSNDGRPYPWGQSYDATRVPTPFYGRSLPGPDDVGTHPTGASPFGVQDMVGLVWQWTNTFSDEHTRAASVKGGSYYQPQGAMWYFPNLFRVDEHGKLLLVGPSLDRSACIGFRCVIEQ